MLPSYGIPAFRVAFENIRPAKLADRALFRRAARSDGILQLVWAEFNPGISDLEEGENFLDWLGNAFKWIIENQDEIIAFLQKIFELIALFGV